jgi:hypothetical protein
MRFLNTISTIRFFFEIGTEYDINLGRHLNPELPPMRDFASRQAQLALFPKTKFRLQKCNTCRVVEKQSRTIKCLQ